MMFYYGSASNGCEFGLRTENFQGGGYVAVQFYGEDVTVYAPGSDDGAWHHYCVTYDDFSVWTVYMDGYAIANGTKSVLTGGSGDATPLRVGNRDTGTHEFHGSLDELDVYNVSLSAESVLALAESRLGLTAPPTTVPEVAVVTDTAPTFDDRYDVSVSGPKDVFAVDVDGDGDVDMVSANFKESAIGWTENMIGSLGLVSHSIYEPVSGAKSVFAVDVDGDGDVDVLSASYNDNSVWWYEREGATWDARLIDVDATYVYDVVAVDVDGDADVDVLDAVVSGDRVDLWLNDGAESFFGAPIDAAADSPRSVFATDINDDGTIDVVAASANQILIYYNHGVPDFIRTIVAAGDVSSAYAAVFADLEGDGMTFTGEVV